MWPRTARPACSPHHISFPTTHPAPQTKRKQASTAGILCLLHTSAAGHLIIQQDELLCVGSRHSSSKLGDCSTCLGEHTLQRHAGCRNSKQGPSPESNTREKPLMITPRVESRDVRAGVNRESKVRAPLILQRARRSRPLPAQSSLRALPRTPSTSRRRSDDRRTDRRTERPHAALKCPSSLDGWGGVAVPYQPRGILSAGHRVLGHHKANNGERSRPRNCSCGRLVAEG